MKKIFACSNGVEFFSDGKSILGTLSKEEAMSFINEIAVDAAQSEEDMAAAIMLLQAIDESYIQLSEITGVEVVIIIRKYHIK